MTLTQRLFEAKKALRYGIDQLDWPVDKVGRPQPQEEAAKGLELLWGVVEKSVLSGSMHPQDDHLDNMLGQIRDYLFQNKPVQAMDWLRKIEKHIEERREP